ncbi:methyl-CpG-binding domain-containing protein 4-like [Solanum dulcamara]|uniref:methyl-CpG-binding domain-containing protein 4-like n=1 Tax=Solanum dulcamara TaxID=45834 RepID=UPI00248530B6|nr:methyl-CpG-binding domain-containing protein 4-like [Solanum dulcamara]
MAKDSPKTPKTSSSRLATNPSVSIWAAQCGKCLKWRTISTQEEFEEIRSRFIEEPFNCDNKPNGSCDDPADIEYDSSRTWVIDKPNLPKTPSGFKRELYLRRDYSKMDAYYFTPSGKKLRSFTEVGAFLQQNSEYSEIKASDFSFTSPKIMDDTIPSTPLLSNSNKKGTTSSTK